MSMSAFAFVAALALGSDVPLPPPAPVLPPPQPVSITISDDDRISVRGRDFTAKADKADFDPATMSVCLTGEDGEPVVVKMAGAKAGRREVLRACKVVINLGTGEIRAEGVKGMSRRD
jgi:hypothetical protein